MVRSPEQEEVGDRGLCETREELVSLCAMDFSTTNQKPALWRTQKPPEGKRGSGGRVQRLGVGKEADTE